MMTSTFRPSSSSGASFGWRFSDRSHGDFGGAVDAGLLAERCRDLVPYPWTLLRQVHGAEVVQVREPGGSFGSTGDAAVTTQPGAVLAIRTADCASVVLAGYHGGFDMTGIEGANGGDRGSRKPVVVGVTHAGWRGLLGGVLQNTVTEMRSLGAEQVLWLLGPCISPASYEFGEADLERLSDRYGPTVRSLTSTGTPAFDLPAGVHAAMSECGAVPAWSDPPCTAERMNYFSWRQRRDEGRQVAAVWIAGGPTSTGEA